MHELKAMLRQQPVIHQIELLSRGRSNVPIAAVDDAPTHDGAGLIPSSKASTRERQELRRLVELHRIRLGHFGERMFVEPIWSMLLDLFENDLLDRPVSVSSLYQIPEVPISTALRRIDDLEESGWISRYPDPLDGRRTLVCLTGYGKSRMTGYFSELLDGIRNRRLLDNAKS